MTYTDDTLMPFGSNKGVKLKDLKPHYLLWIYKNVPNLHLNFKVYIDSVRPKLELMSAHEKQQRKLKTNSLK